MKNLKLNRISAMLIFLLLFSLMPFYTFGQSSAAFNLKTSQSDSRLTISVCINAAEDISAFQFSMMYDKTTLNLESAALQGAYTGMMSAVNTNDPGTVRVAAASATAVEGDKEKTVFKVIFTVQKNTDISIKITDAVICFDDEQDQYPADKKFDINKSGTVSGEEQSGNISDSSNSNNHGNSGSEPSQNGSSAGSDSQNAESSVNTGSVIEEIFSDIKGSWAEKYIEAAYEAGLMQGYGDSTFGPDKQITRAQMAVVLWNSEGMQNPTKAAEFTDLSADWYKDAVAWTAEKGYMKGVGNNKFNPNGALTREQLAQIMMNKSGQSSGMETMFTSVYDSQYKDSASISSWAKPALYWSLYNGILCGTDSAELKDTLAAKQPASRAEIAVMLVKYQEKFAFM